MRVVSLKKTAHNNNINNNIICIIGLHNYHYWVYAYI